MELTVKTKNHEKIKVLAVDLEHGMLDFQWLEKDGSPSKIYSGVCRAEIGGAMELSKKDIANIQTGIEAVEALKTKGD